MKVPPEDHPKFTEQTLRRREETAHRQAARRQAEPYPSGWYIIFGALLGVAIFFIAIVWMVTV